jgi:hypothetical protein
MSTDEVVRELNGGYTVVSRMRTSGYAQDVIVVDSCAYIAQGQGGIAIVNVKDPQHPKLMAELLNDIPGYSNKVAYTKDSTGTEVIYSADGAPGVATVIVNDKYHPTVPRRNNGFKPALSFFVVKRILLTMISADGIWISDISNARNVFPLFNIQVPGYAKSVCVSSDSTYALLAIGEGGMVMLDFSKFNKGRDLPDSSNISKTFSGRLDLPGSSEYIANIPGKKCACIACGPEGLQIVDYTNISDIKITGSFATGGFARDVCVSGDRAFLATEKEGVQIIDISNLSSPRRIGKVNLTDARSVDVNNGYLYVSDEQDGLIIIKIP